MCYADAVMNDDGTAIAFCYCGWMEEDNDTLDAAHAAAARHVAETEAAEAALV